MEPAQERRLQAAAASKNPKLPRKRSVPARHSVIRWRMCLVAR
jgi:hypothetical protein